MYSKEFKKEEFINPPNEYGEVSFYWWAGEKLTKERLLWQLEKLKQHHICGLQINYCHTDKGGLIYGLPYESDPKQFSDEWWQLVNWFISECKNSLISVSLSDYTLGTAGQGYFMDRILEENPDILGRELSCHKTQLKESTNYEIQKNDNIISVIAIDSSNKIIDITEKPYFISASNCIIYTIGCHAIPHSLDPMNSKAGSEVIRTFFQPFEINNPGEAGKALNFFFSDELQFNIRGNLWNDTFADNFIKIKGYDVRPYLAAIFYNIGNITPKIRLDYYDVIVRLEEENYFKPIFEWHEQRNMTYGCDHGGRGKDITEFGDYFRTQKYNQGPGNDQPNLASDIIKNKVNSSISHMYNRPRTWLEGFYGSGWATSSADVADATFRNFAMGHNLLTLHGLYYTTYGGYWEWAPPCNHWRMPYWSNMDDFLKMTKRLSYLNTRGYHSCDIAILYPVAAVEGGMDGEKAVEAAFLTAEYLYNNAVDLDFIDFESLDRAKVSNGALSVSGENYKAIIVPNMKTIRFSNIKKLLEFKNAGGLVVCIGDSPIASDNAGKNDPLLDGLVSQIFTHINMVETPQQLLSLLDSTFERDFKVIDSSDNAYILHRTMPEMEYYMVYGVEKGSQCFFRCKGSIEIFDALNGKVFSYHNKTETPNGTIIKMPFSAKEPQLIAFRKDVTTAESFYTKKYLSQTILEGDWEFELVPTLDNKYGDFSLPAFDGFIGCQARKLYMGGKKKTIGFGPYFNKFGPIKSSSDISIIESCLISKQPCGIKPEPYEFSMQYGKEGDPGHQGYHGLKMQISDEFICLGKPVDKHRYYEYVPEIKNGIYFLTTSVYSDTFQTVNICNGSLKPEKIWINGNPIFENTATVKEGFNDIVLKYAQSGRTYFILEKQDKVDFVQKTPLSMKWYNNPNVLPFDLYKNPGAINEFIFQLPPAAKRIKINAYGKLTLKINSTIIPPKAMTLTNDVYCYDFDIDNSNPYAQEAELSVISKNGRYSTALFENYIDIDCGTGKISLGDWGALDCLEFYSGGAKYKKHFDVSDETDNYLIDLGDLCSSCELYLNGTYVGSKAFPDWEFDISDMVKNGTNQLEIIIFNTLSNHYRTIPTKYNNSSKSGLFGPVKVIRYNTYK